jgi:hypothetical protein
MAAALRLRMLAGALQQRQQPATHRSNSATTATATAAPSPPRGRPKLLLAFALTPEMELEGCVESFWLPAAMPRLAELAELTITVRALPGRLSAISVFPCKSVLYGANCMGAQGA